MIAICLDQLLEIKPKSRGQAMISISPGYKTQSVLPSIHNEWKNIRHISIVKHVLNLTNITADKASPVFSKLKTWWSQPVCPQQSEDRQTSNRMATP